MRPSKIIHMAFKNQGKYGEANSAFAKAKELGYDG
jgi:hypothetical protein